MIKFDILKKAENKGDEDMKKNILKTLQKYIVFFYIYAFLGWVIDVSIVLVSDGILENRGFLYETICPMYGFAALVLVVISEKIRGKGGVIKRIAIATVWCSVLEYLTSLILEVFFGIRWWDYTNEPYNIQGRICLAASVFWGFLSILFMKDIHPFIEKRVRKVSSKLSEKTKNIIVYTALTGTMVDFVFSIVKYLK